LAGCLPSCFGKLFARASIALLVLALLISACQGSGIPSGEFVKTTPTRTQEPGTTDTAVPQSPSITATLETTPAENSSLPREDLEGAELSLWHVWSGELGETFERLVAEFNAENQYGIQVTAVYQGNYNELYEKVGEAIPTGELPSISVGHNYEILAWHDREALINLNDYINDPDWGLDPGESGDFYPVFWEPDEDGLRLGVPVERFSQLLYYNLSWAKELGYDSPPQTPRQFSQQVCAAAQANRSDGEPDNDGTGGWIVNTSPSVMIAWMYAFGGQVVDSQGTGYQFDTPQTEAALEFLKSLHDSGCTWETTDGHAAEEFAGRQALFITASIADLPAQRAAFAEAGNQDEWTVLAFPASREPVLPVYGPDFTVFRSSEGEQLAAWLFLKWFLSPENQAHWVSAGQTFPLRTTTLEYLEDFSTEHPQWFQAVQLLGNARREPALRSWSVVRWVVSDVGTQMFRSYFSADRIPSTVELLAETAAELHERAEP
jgi:multiple sugar transport system substrate-binding protein/sn-glycerol 3-phosphate transport system substrate-binding protein